MACKRQRRLASIANWLFIVHQFGVFDFHFCPHIRAAAVFALNARESHYATMFETRLIQCDQRQRVDCKKIQTLWINLPFGQQHDALYNWLSCIGNATVWCSARNAFYCQWRCWFANGENDSSQFSCDAGAIGIRHGKEAWLHDKGMYNTL